MPELTLNIGRAFSLLEQQACVGVTQAVGREVARQSRRRKRLDKDLPHPALVQRGSLLSAKDPGRQIDILVLNRQTGRTFKVEVKTTEGRSRGSKMFRRHYSWLMNVKHGRITDENLVYCFVLLGPGTAGATQRRIFLVPAVEVARYIRWNQRYWEKGQRAKGKHGKETSIRQFRVPAEEGKVVVPRSWRPKELWRTWEDNWKTFGPSPSS